MSQSPNYISVLKETLEKKLDTLQSILELTKQQEEISKREVYPEVEMEQILNIKEVQIARLNSLDEGFQAIYDRVKTQVKEHPDTYKNEIRELQEQIRLCTQTGNEIMVLEQRNKAKFVELFSKSKMQYSTSKTKASVAQNYVKTMTNSKMANPYFVDKKQ